MKDGPRTPKAFLREHYTTLYRKFSSDSHEDSWKNLARTLMNTLRSLHAEGRENVTVLDIGSGPQGFEAHLSSYGQSKDKEILGATHFITLDQADIPKEKLRRKNAPNVSHIQADGNHLPLQDECTDVVISSMALDYIGKDAVQELARVLKKGGNCIVTLHHPHLIHGLLQEVGDTSDVKAFLEHAQQHVIYKNPDEIRKVFEAAGLTVDIIEEQRPDPKPFQDLLARNAWWFVRAHK